MVRRSQDITYSYDPKSYTPVEVDDKVGGAVIAELDEQRISITLQNIGVYPCLIALGDTPSGTNFNLILCADTVANAGKGGSVTLEGYQGDIHGITLEGTTSIAVLEQISYIVEEEV